ncbi:MAG: undecaprenyl-diphosphate phosphatase [Thermodesulfobacteriota bacterium]
MDIIIALVLGLVEGLTEFLPVSSTGHLILAGHFFGFTGPKAATFEIVIQLGAILSVVVLYRQRFAGLIPARSGPRPPFSGWRGLWLLFLTSLPPALLGLLIHDVIKERLFNPMTVAWALAVGGLAMILAEGRKSAARITEMDRITPKMALGIGLFQCLSLWPGFSRSAATIMGGMILGTDRKVAAEYSFVAAVPIMIAATGYDFYKCLDLLDTADLPFFAAGFGVSFVSALLAVEIFIRLVGRMSLRPFAYYRLVLAPLVLLFWA